MIYFDNSATSYPKPQRVSLAIREAISKYGANPGRSSYAMAIETSEKVYKARESLAKLFNLRDSRGKLMAENVIFTPSCTYGINLALKAYLKKGDRVISSDLEHNAVYRPLFKLSSEGNISYDIFETSQDDEETLSKLKFAIENGKKPALVALTSASNAFGFVLPIQKIGKLLSSYSIPFLLDASQSAGIIPIDMESSSIDILCVPGHKSLYGILGTGAVLFGREFSKNCHAMQTLIEGGTGSLSLSDTMPKLLPERFEAGSLGVLGIISMLEGASFVLEKSEERLSFSENLLAGFIYRELKKDDSIILFSPEPKLSGSVPIISFLKKGQFSEETARLLGERDIAVRGGYQCSALAHRKMKTERTGVVRASLGAFSTYPQCEIFLSQLKKI